MALFGLLKPDVEKLAAKNDVKGLIKALEYRQSEQVRRDAAAAFQKVKLNGDLESACSALARALADQDEAVRKNAVSALGSVRDGRAIEPLLAALRDKNPEIRRLAVKGLGDFSDSRAGEALLAAFQDENSAVRVEVVQALRSSKDSRTVDLFSRALKDESWSVRHWTAYELHYCKDSRVVEPLLVALQDKETIVRSAAVETLKVIGDLRAVDPLINVLKDSDVKTQMKAQEALLALVEKDQKVVDRLIGGIRSDSTAIRYGSLRVLEKIHDPRVVEALLGILRNPAETVDLRRSAINSLGTLKVADATEDIVAALSHPELCYSAGLALAKIGGEQAVNALVLALSSESEKARDYAAEALRELNHPKAKEALRAAARAKVGLDLSEKQMFQALVDLAAAYSANDKAEIARLAPLGKQIGEYLNSKGGIEEMRQVLTQVQRINPIGARSIEYHWGGIGQWHG